DRASAVGSERARFPGADRASLPGPGRARMSGSEPASDWVGPASDWDRARTFARLLIPSTKTRAVRTRGAEGDHMATGYLSIVLHAHLPFVRHPEDATVMEEQWLYEAITGTYLPLIQMFEGLLADGVRARATVSLSAPLIN